jgi:hypothetical protein
MTRDFLVRSPVRHNGERYEVGSIMRADKASVQHLLDDGVIEERRVTDTEHRRATVQLRRRLRVTEEENAALKARVAELEARLGVAPPAAAPEAPRPAPDKRRLGSKQPV